MKPGPNLYTPVFRAVRANLFEPDEPKKLPDGRVVGSGKYNIVGFFDPSQPKARQFLDSVVEYAQKAGHLSRDAAYDVVHGALPTAAALRENGSKVHDAIPDSYRRIRASSRYGPIRTLRRNGSDATKSDVYPGVWLVGYVKPSLYAIIATTKSITFYLSAALVWQDDDPLYVPRQDPMAENVFAEYIVTDDVPF